MKTLPFCKDCKHCNSHADKFTNWLCNREGLNLKSKEVTNIITGEVHTEYVDSTEFFISECNLQRYGGWFTARINNRCGKEGRFFEDKNTISVDNKNKDPFDPLSVHNEYTE